MSQTNQTMIHYDYKKEHPKYHLIEPDLSKAEPLNKVEPVLGGFEGDAGTRFRSPPHVEPAHKG
jgi:hypothetical protein